MATLTGNSVASTYKQLLKVTSEGIGADASAKYIEDGLGTDSALSISTTRVGIGTASPQKLLDITDSSSGESIPVVISNKDVTAGTGQKVTLGFGLVRNSGAFKPEAGTIEVGRELDWAASDANIDSYMAFSTYLNNAATEKMRINSSGNVTVSTGNLIIGTAGKGIDFSADGNAAGMTSELLDDYEEGTFTPDINGTTSGTTTYAAGFPLGKYTKVGRVVHFNIYATWTGATGSGDFRINGLPFTAANDVHRTIVTMALADYTIATSGDLVYGRINENLTNIVPQVVPSGGGSEGLTFDTTGTVFASGSYMV